MKRAALYLRVSKGIQHTENQLEPLQQFCKERGLTIVRTYEENSTARTAGHQPQWSQLVKDAAHRHFDYVVTWSLDRITREGIDTIFLRIKTLKGYGVTLLSYQEAIDAILSKTATATHICLVLLIISFSLQIIYWG